MTEWNKRVTELTPEQRAQLERQLFGNLGKKVEQVAQDVIPIQANRDRLPLSFCQRRLWFVDQLEPGNPAYNSPDALLMYGPLEIDLLKKGLNEIVRRHESLRTIFHEEHGEPYQVISPDATLEVPLVDLTGCPEESLEATAQNVLDQEARRPFDLSRDLVIRALIVRKRPEEHLLQVTLHHIASDGWSMRNLFRELSALYNASLAGTTAHLPELPIQYGDYAVWQRDRLQGEAFDQQLGYWMEKLHDLPTLDLPLDHPRPPVQSHSGKTESIEVKATLIDELRDVGRQVQATLYMTMLTAFEILLYRYSGQEDIVVGSSVAGRTRREVENLIGFFVNTLVLRTNSAGNPTYLELLRHVREETLEAFSHQELPFEILVEKLQPERDPSKMPLFQVLFQVQERASQPIDFQGLDAYRQGVETGGAKFDLMVNVVQNVGGYRIDFEYNENLFDATTVQQLLRHFVVLLQGIVENPQERIATLPLLTEAEQHQLVYEFNDTIAEHPDLCLHEMFEQHVHTQPDAVAVQFGAQRLTYAELESKSNQVAHYLKKHGIGPESAVGLCVERSLEMVVGMIGILKSGAAYAPLDPSYPPERLEFMVQDAQTPVLITQAHLLSALPATDAEIICLDRDWNAIGQEPTTKPDTGVTPDHPSYIIYTSGTTGVPKGIIVLHRGVVNNIADLNRRFQVGPGDKVLGVSSLSFDMCVYEVFGLLGAGGTVILPQGEEAKDPARWLELVTQHQITVWNSAPSLLDLLVSFVEQSAVQRLPIRLVLLGGDWVPVPLPDRLKALAPGAQVIVMGGATEASIHSIIYQVEATDPNWTSIPYGKPMANQTAFLLDAHCNLVPIGVAGELHLGGSGLARGYLNRPELTAEKFIANPFRDGRSDRLYKTGDLARYRADGTIELLGRIDLRVKIHGLRIEVGEIEVALKEASDVKEAVVTAYTDERGVKSLVGYVVPRQPHHLISAADLRDFLSAKLPKYMVPATFVQLEKLPLSPNGKVDRKSLPLPQIQVKPKAVVPPQNDTEARLVQIWCEVLGRAEVSVEDNFFEIGGDSFKAIKAIRSFDDKLPLVELFKQPTIRGLADSMRKQERSPAKRLQRLTEPRQHKNHTVVCVPYGGGSAVVYQPLAKELSTDFELYAVDLPGHDYASREQAFVGMEELVKQCVQEIQADIDGPILLYGQCAGVAVTVELARALQERNVQVDGIFLGASLPNPNVKRSIERDQALSDQEWQAFLTDLGGFEEVLDPEEMAHIISAVRHDLLVSATYFASHPQFAAEKKLQAPLYCLIGDEDASTPAYQTRYRDWGNYATSVTLETIAGGGHYFVKHDAKQVAQFLQRLVTTASHR